MILKELLDLTSKRLRMVNAERSINEARLLISKVLGRRPDELTMIDHQTMTARELESVENLVKRRLKLEPMAYILGEKEFFNLRFKVNPHVLIPRPETEALVEEVLSWIKKNGISQGRILDLATGSGCIAVSLAAHLPRSFSIHGLDSSDLALQTARENIKRLKVNVELIHADLLQGPSPDLGTFSILISNPPYIPSAEISALQEDIKAYEPQMALDGGEDGLAFYRAILDLWIPICRGRCLIALETHDQSQREWIRSQISSKARTIWEVGCHILIEMQN